MNSRYAALSVAAVALFACHGGGPGGVSPDGLPAPKRTAACYALDYGKDELATRLPALIALDEGGGSGRAFWFPGARRDTTWRRFYSTGHWDREGRGHVVVDFEAEEVHIKLELEQAGGMLSGHATRRTAHAEGQPTEQSAALEGKHVNCPRPPTNAAGD